MDFFKTKDVDWVKLPKPNDSVSFFEAIKKESEKYWSDTSPNDKTYGYQVQQATQWKRGLTDNELLSFEKEVGFIFPKPLRNFYQTMNGLTKPGINVFGSSGTLPTFRSVFYSYPDDLSLIQELKDWIYKATYVKEIDLEQLDISKIFPVYGHRFMLLDVPENPILSMHGDDIIYYADNLSKLLARECFDNIYNVSDFESSGIDLSEIKFWLDEHD